MCKLGSCTCDFDTDFEIDTKDPKDPNLKFILIKKVLFTCFSSCVLCSGQSWPQSLKMSNLDQLTNPLKSPKKTESMGILLRRQELGVSLVGQKVPDRCPVTQLGPSV